MELTATIWGMMNGAFTFFGMLLFLAVLLYFVLTPEGQESSRAFIDETAQWFRHKLGTDLIERVRRVRRAKRKK